MATMIPWASGTSTSASTGTITYYLPSNSTVSAGQMVWLNSGSSGTIGNLSSPPYIPSKIPAGARTIELPDGAKLVIDDQGNYKIEDKDAKVTYQANRMREFSPHLNASDMLAAFVKYVGSLGVKQGEVLGLPIELFINWLVIEAAERDKDPLPEDVIPVAKHAVILDARKPRCLRCRRFIPLAHHRNRFPFCNVDHGIAHVERLKAPQLALANN